MAASLASRSPRGHLLGRRRRLRARHGRAVSLDLAALTHLGVDNWPHLPLPPNLPQEPDAMLLVAMSFERQKRPTAPCSAPQFEAVMKHHNLSASDKDIARWVERELRLLVPAFQA